MKKKVLLYTASLIFAIACISIIPKHETMSLYRLGNIIHIATILLNTSVLGSFGYFIFNRYAKKTPAQLKRSIIPLFLGFVSGALVISLAIISIGNYAFYSMEGINSVDLINKLYQVELPEAIHRFLIWIPIVSVFLFYILWNQAINRELLLHEENLKHQYQTLKAQVNPHFLFNTLNTLSEIVHVDPQKADNYIQKLAGIYRYILENEKNDLVPLEKEIQFITQYFALQKEREENKVQLIIDIGNIDKHFIVPISLQILIENALKHNQRSVEKPLSIHVYQNDTYITVSNRIQPKSILRNDSTGMGLPNLKMRVYLITHKEVIINHEHNLFTVKIPIIVI